MSALEAEFAKCFPGGPTIHGSLRLPAGPGPVTVLFGPSGSGKTTLLRCLAGLERPDAGFIRFEGRTWWNEAGAWVPPQRREVGYLSQDYALFPHLTAAGNIAFGLGGLPGAERRRRVGEMIALLGLAGLEGRYPGQLSGGQQQRVALARALARRPLLLLDEPLSALDTPTRGQLRRELRRLLAGLAVPAIVVTHDRTEALGLAESVVVLVEGKVRQSGSAAEVFARPADLAVARAVGMETITPAQVLEVSGGVALVSVGQARIAVAAPAVVGPATLCIRAEDVILEAGTLPAGVNRLPGQVRALDREGPMTRVSLDCGFPLVALIAERTARNLRLHEGACVTAVLDVRAPHLVPTR
jgi:molybdate transport system ATP-binding protein